MLDSVAGVMPAGSTLAEVRVSVGPLSGVTAASLEFCFAELARERGYPKARLVITRTRARARCRPCGECCDIDVFDTACPKCGSLDRGIESGREFTLDSIEVEES